MHSYAPTDMVDAIYTDVPGAYFDPAIQYWRVPCDAEINMAVQIGLVFSCLGVLGIF